MLSVSAQSTMLKAYHLIPEDKNLKTWQTRGSQVEHLDEMLYRSGVIISNPVTSEQIDDREQNLPVGEYQVFCYQSSPSNMKEQS